MPKLFSLMQIIRKDAAGADEIIPAKTVFNGSVTEAKEYDAIKAARPATKAEAEAAAQAEAKANGLTPADAGATTEAAPASIAKGDPNGKAG